MAGHKPEALPVQMHKQSTLRLRMWSGACSERICFNASHAPSVGVSMCSPKLGYAPAPPEPIWIPTCPSNEDQACDVQQIPPIASWNPRARAVWGVLGGLGKTLHLMHSLWSHPWGITKPSNPCVSWRVWSVESLSLTIQLWLSWLTSAVGRCLLTPETTQMNYWIHNAKALDARRHTSFPKAKPQGSASDINQPWLPMAFLMAKIWLILVKSLSNHG